MVYEFIFDSMFYVFSTSIIISIIVMFIFRSKDIWIESLLFNYSLYFAVGFYFVLFFFEKKINKWDVFAGFFFEFLMLILVLFYFRILKLNSFNIKLSDIRILLQASLFLSLTFFLFNFSLKDFGLFSTGARIDYLKSNPFAKYFTYAGLLVSMLQAPLLASFFTKNLKFGKLGSLVIFSNFLFSVLSGSKGGFFLWILVVVSFINDFSVFSKYHLFAFGTVIFSLFAVSIFVISSSLGLPIEVFLNLILARFFLSNDARALAFDLRDFQLEQVNFFLESFRSVSRVFDLKISNEPLGVLLYQNGLGIFDGSGANASFMAISVYYFPDGFSFIPVFFGIFILMIIISFNFFILKFPLTVSQRFVLISFFLTSLTIFSQDFLSFQLIYPLYIFTFIFFLAFNLIKRCLINVK